MYATDSFYRQKYTNKIRVNRNTNYYIVVNNVEYIFVIRQHKVAKRKLWK